MPTPRVLKLGGSLLLLPDWPERLTAWIQSHPAPLNLLLVGGGQVVDAVRELDRQHNFPAPFSHWLCIDLLSATARIASQLLPTFPLIITADELQRVVRDRFSGDSVAGEDVAEFSGDRGSPPSLRASATYIVDVRCFYQPPALEEPDGAKNSESIATDCPLPESWETTSDSLAAWLANVVQAAELVLFKSTTPPRNCHTPQAWVEQSIVDAAFADTLPTTLSVSIVDLLKTR